MLMSTYEKNLEVLQNIDIVLATKIIQSSQAQSFELLEVSPEHKLYNIYDTLQEALMYDDIIEELKAEVHGHSSFSTHPFIYIYGMANAYGLSLLLNNTNHQRIVIIEPELEILFVIFHLYDFSKALESKRLIIIHQRDLNVLKATELFTQKEVQHHARSFKLIVSCQYYQKNFEEEIKKSEDLLIDTLMSHINQDVCTLEEILTSAESLTKQQRDQTEALFKLLSQQYSDFDRQNDVDSSFKALSTLQTTLSHTDIYQSFLKDFLYPSLLLYFIEIADIKTQTIKSDAMKEQQYHQYLKIHQLYFKTIIESLQKILDIQIPVLINPEPACNTKSVFA